MVTLVDVESVVSVYISVYYSSSSLHGCDDHIYLQNV